MLPAFALLILVLLIISIPLVFLPQLQKRTSNIDIEPIPESILNEVENLSFVFRGAQIAFKLSKCSRPKSDPVLLIHGIGASSYIWRKIEPLLCKHTQVFSLDLPGFGQSSIPDHFQFTLEEHAELINQFYRHIGVQKMVIVGSSLGGAIGLWYAAFHKDSVSTLFLLSPALFPNRVPHWIPLKILLSGQRLVKRTLTRQTMKLFIRSVVNKTTPIDEEMIDGYLTPFISGSALTAFYLSLVTLKDKRLAEHYKVACPTFVIHGALDRQVKLSDIQSLLSRIETVTALIVRPLAAHHLMEDEPEWLANCVAERSSRLDTAKV